MGQLSWEPSLSAVWIDQGDRVHYVIMAWMTNHHSCIVCNEYTCPSSTLEPTLRDTWSPLITGQYGTTPSRYRILPFDAYNPAVPHQHLSDFNLQKADSHLSPREPRYPPALPSTHPPSPHPPRSRPSSQQASPLRRHRAVPPSPGKHSQPVVFGVDQGDVQG